MSSYHDLVQALTWLVVQKLQRQGRYVRGLLGDGQGHVEVPGRADHSYVRPDRYTTRKFEVFNKLVDGYDGMPVVLGELPWQPGLTQVLAVDYDTYEGVGWGDAWSGVKKHGKSHEHRDGAPGYDTFNVYRRQFGDLKTYPLGSGSLSVYVSAYNFTHLESLKTWPGYPGTSLAGAVPSATGTARMVLVYWDPASGTSGALGIATGTLGGDADPEILNWPYAPAGTIPSAWVKLRGGQGNITEFDIWDARQPWTPTLEFSTGSAGIWAGLIPIADDGGFFTGSTVEQALQEIAGSGGAYPFDIITVDANDPQANYDDLDDAFAAEPGGTAFELGPGTYTLTANGLPATSFLSARFRDPFTQVRGYEVGGVQYGLVQDGVAYVRNLYMNGVSATAPASAVYVADTSTYDNCHFVASAQGGADDAYGVDVQGDGATIIGGVIQPVSSGGTAYGIRAGGGSTVILQQCRFTIGSNFFTGAGTFTGIFQDNSGNLWEIDGAAGSERLINSFLKASDGAPDPALSADATGKVTAAVSLAMPAGATIDEFSTDGTLAGDSDNAVPTEKAVKTYVDGTLVDWTPVLTQSGAVAHTVSYAKYRLIGKLLHIECKLVVTGSGTGGNAIVITGWPAAIDPAWSGLYHALGGFSVFDNGSRTYSYLAVYDGTGLKGFDNATANLLGINPNIALAATDEVYLNATWFTA